MIDYLFTYSRERTSSNFSMSQPTAHLQKHIAMHSGQLYQHAHEGYWWKFLVPLSEQLHHLNWNRHLTVCVMWGMGEFWTRLAWHSTDLDTSQHVAGTSLKPSRNASHLQKLRGQAKR